MEPVRGTRRRPPGRGHGRRRRRGRAVRGAGGRRRLADPARPARARPPDARRTRTRVRRARLVRPGDRGVHGHRHLALRRAPAARRRRRPGDRLRARGRRTLVASSQGDSTFATFRIDRGWKPERTIAIGDSRATDGVQHSDGAAVVTTPLGRAFPRGLLVVHDGDATPYETGADGQPRTSTNFKLVDWGAVSRR
ncbi:phytase [Mumia quercus]|uniref:phytase n=1 Tax=Mumia quercus TaxID=2976125 RepID=UPI00355770EB